MIQATQNRRKFYIITGLVLITIIGTAIFIVAYMNYSYVKIEVVGSSSTSFVLAYDSISTPLSASENATVEVLPHANVTITASPTAGYTVVRWNVSGVTFTQKAPDSINFLTGQGGTAIRVSAELARANSST